MGPTQQLEQRPAQDEREVRVVPDRTLRVSRCCGAGFHLHSDLSSMVPIP
jgi:hypothetical protein